MYFPSKKAMKKYKSKMMNIKKEKSLKKKKVEGDTTNK
jgi:hypothetical protein